MPRNVHTIREYDRLEPSDTLNSQDIAELAGFARQVLHRSDGNLAATNHVGVVTTRRGVVLEILPKIDLDDANPSHERTRRSFLQMLRTSRRMGTEMPLSDIRAMSRFPMLEAFVRQFLHELAALFRNALARRYVTIEDNQPFLRGRLLFKEHVRENASNRTRFFASHDELSVDRPANRLIRRAVQDLSARIRDPGNRQLLREAAIAMAKVPPSRNIAADWRAHHVDRSMQHYRPVMAWLQLFLFNRGLAAYSGSHANVSMLFPMEQVFEDFVTASFRRHQRRFRVVRQGPREFMTTIDGLRAFAMQPDIALMSRDRVAFILDAKWKRIDASTDDRKHKIIQADLYQLYAYASRYGCKAVALVYPANSRFRTPLTYTFFDGTALLAIPFQVTDPRQSVTDAIRSLERSQAAQ